MVINPNQLYQKKTWKIAKYFCKWSHQGQTTRTLHYVIMVSVNDERIVYRNRSKALLALVNKSVIPGFLLIYKEPRRIITYNNVKIVFTSLSLNIFNIFLNFAPDLKTLFFLCLHYFPKKTRKCRILNMLDKTMQITISTVIYIRTLYRDKLWN